jgi:hypothetical protein
MSWATKLKNGIGRLRGQKFDGSSFSRRRNHSQPPSLETLEGRELPSTILWTNEGNSNNDSDNFNATYSGNAATARTVAEAAILRWETIIQDFNYRNVGQSGWAPTANTYSLSISARDLGGGGRGVTNVTGVDGDGKPFSATIGLDDDGGGPGWFFDSTPGDSGEFTSLLTRYTATFSGNTNDFERTISHEIGHAMGILIDSRFALYNDLTAGGTDQSGSGNGGGSQLYLFSAGTTTATFTAYNGGHIYEGPVDPNFPNDPVSPNELMNDGRTVGAPPTERELPTALDASILRDAYGYTVEPISDMDSFLAAEENGVLTINNDPQVTNETITLDTGSILGIPLIEVNVDGVTSAWFGFAVSSIVVTPGTGANTINILRNLSGIPISVMSQGSDTVNIGHDGTVQDNLGDITIENPPRLTDIVVDDSADTTARTITLGTFTPAGDTAFGSITGLAPATINYEFNDTNSLTIKTGNSGGNVVNVQATGTTTNVIGNAPFGGPDDTVNVGNAGSVQSIFCTVNIENPPSFNDITVDDSADPNNPTVTLSTLGTNPTDSEGDGDIWGQISGLAPANINYEYRDTNSLTVKTGIGLVTVDVLATGPSVTTNLVATTVTDGSGPTSDTTVNVGNAGSVQAIQGALNIENPVFFNDITVDDSVDTGNPTVTLSTLGANPTDSEGNSDVWGQISGLAPANINYEYGDTNSLTVTTGTGLVTADVLATGTTIKLMASAGAGTTVNVGSASNTFDPIVGTLDIEGAGNTTLAVNDTGTSSIQQWDVGSSYIDRFPFPGTRPAVPQITYHNLSSVTVNTGVGKSFIGVEGTAAGTTTIVNGNGFIDEFIVQNFSDSLGDDFNGPLQIHDANAYNLLIDDTTNPAAHTYTFTSGELQRDGMQPITFDTNRAHLVEFTASAGGGTVNVPTYTGNSFGVILANSGDTVTIGSSAAQGISGFSGDVRVQALLGQTPHVILDDSADPTARTIDMGSDAAFGYQPGTFGYVLKGLGDPSLGRGRIGLEMDAAAPVSILGGAADDVFRVHDFVGAPAISIDAEPSGSTRPNQHNQLDYSLYTGTVEVVLSLGQATGFASVVHIQDITGSNGNNLLVGDTGANILFGGTGRNVLIGGAGADRLDASLSHDDNLLIGGTTTYDGTANYRADLDAIFAEWTRTDLSSKNSFMLRYSDLFSGDGTSNPLNKVNGQLILLNGQTVHGDGVPDTLTGTNLVNLQTGKRAHNWFFVDSFDTLVNFDTGNDRKTKTK